MPESGAQPHILVVDDARDIREPLVRYLKELGYRASSADSAAAARRAMRTSGIDLVILDIMMPGEDGLSLCRSIRESSGIPVIMLTARGEELDRIVGLEVGADDYVAKPFNPRELLARVGAVLRRTNTLPPRLRGPTAERYRFGDNGASEGFHPLSATDQKTIREKYTWGCPYFLHVGLIHPRKNLTSLIEAFDNFRLSVQSDVKLLVVGERKWWTDEMQQALENAEFKNDIIFTGRVLDKDLSLITASALAMVYVTHFEGFGIPVLEAMQCDIPVITSAVTSLPEVGGDAVLYVDPYDIDSIKSAMLAVYSDTDLRNELISNARKQREKFTWKKTAGLMWNSIEKCF